MDDQPNWLIVARQAPGQLMAGFSSMMP